MSVTPTARYSPTFDREGNVNGGRSQRGRPLWPWERAANERFRARYVDIPVAIFRYPEARISD